MKKLFSLLMLLCACVALHAENDVLFVYSQWGTDAFLKSDIDSITYSHYDEENLYHSEWYAQIIHTPDSAYYYPLALIYNMEFKSTERVYQSDVKEMSDDLLSYIIAYTDSTLTLQPATPTKLIPAIGEVLYYEGNEEPLVEGFAGRMKSLDSYSDSLVCQFDSVGLHDVFKKLMAVGRLESTSDTEAKRAPGKGFWSIFPSLIDKRFEPDGDYEGKVILSSHLTNPQFIFNYIININSDNGDYDYAKIDMYFSSAGSINADLGISGSVSMKKTLFDTEDIPLFDGFVGSFEIAVLAELSGEITGLASVPFFFKLTRSYEYDSYSGWSELDAARRNDYFRFGDPNLQLTGFNGSFFAGIKAELKGGFLSTKLNRFSVEGKAGFQFDAKYPNLIGIDEFDRYDVLKDQEYSRSVVIAAESSFKIFKVKIAEGPSWEREFYKETSPLLPKIDNLKWAPTDIGKGDLTSEISGNLWFPITFGWVMNDESGVRCREGFFSKAYVGNPNKPVQETRMEVKDLPVGYHYWARPAAKFMGLMVPYTQVVEVKPSMVIISDFKVTNSQFKKEGFENDSQKYDFKYNASVKLTLDESIDPSAVSDWGYIYYDLNGDTVHISMKGKPSPYVDTRYAYYRNDIFSTVKLCGYVQYKDRWNYEYDDPLTFDLVFNFCPNDNHPHMIDLGLPSGTKWACCDVGAEHPGEQGLLYAWGETKPKDKYLQTNYKFYHGTDIDGDGYYAYYIKNNEPAKYYAYYEDSDGKHHHGHLSEERYMELKESGDIIVAYLCIHDYPEPWYIDIPRYDIAGSNFDAATVNWGSRWKMPTPAQAVELLNNCSKRYCTDRHGHTYQLIGGPNGKAILMSLNEHWVSKYSCCDYYQSSNEYFCDWAEWGMHINCEAWAYTLNPDNQGSEYVDGDYYTGSYSAVESGQLVRAVGW